MPTEEEFRRMSESSFREWLKSIEFVDDEGKVVPPILEDLDDDPDDDEDYD